MPGILIICSYSIKNLIRICSTGMGDRLYNTKDMFYKADNMNAKGWSHRPSPSDFGKIRITDRSSLETAVALWLADEDAAKETYGDINKWDVSGVTDFSNLFENSDFNSDISNWDVSNGVNFDEMFLYAYNFDQDLSEWEISEDASTVDMLKTKVDLADENLRKFDPGAVGNVNAIDFSTLEEKFYRRFDWEEVDYGQLNSKSKDDIHWDKVVLEKRPNQMILSWMPSTGMR